MRLSRKNDPDSVRARQEALGLPDVDLAPWAKAAESVTGLVSMPVSVAELAVSLGENPWRPRERETPARKSLTGRHGSASMSSRLPLSLAACSFMKFSLAPRRRRST